MDVQAQYELGRVKFSSCSVSLFRNIFLSQRLHVLNVHRRLIKISSEQTQSTQNLAKLYSLSYTYTTEETQREYVLDASTRKNVIHVASI